MLTRKILINATLKVARRRLLKCRLCLLWRNVAIGLFGVYMIFWIHAPAFLGIYWAKSQYSFLAILSVPMLLTNYSFLHSKDSPIAEWSDRILEERKDLKYIISQTKEAIWLLKKWRKEELDIYELSTLVSYLSYVDVDTEWISMWACKLRQTENPAELVSLFDMFQD